MNNNYYTSGKFAKMANVTIRTIRYYDKIGLLKPSFIGENKYRMYTNNDLIKLQRIIFLKQLGFSLEEIFPMVINNDNKDFEYNINMQINLINQQIEHLQTIKESLQSASELAVAGEVNLDEMIKLVKVTNMASDLVQQYRNSNNLNVRMSLHDKYSKSKISWFDWIYNTIDIKDKDVLDVGCGNGRLWFNRDIKTKRLVLTDKSKGMISDAKKVLGDKYEYNVCDLQSLPYDDNSYDVVIANHMLFYMKDIDKALEEIKRVLKPKGILYCSTYGKDHMKEITEMVKEFDPRITLANISLYDIFGLDNGKEILLKHFSNVKKVIHDDYLIVDNYQPIVDYIISCHGNQNEIIGNRVVEFNKFIESKFNKGTIRITKDAGMFIVKNDK
ncbi:MAG: methyltransferase domain-containing protein [Thomasclavelia sp.]|nr:methyltransferase domain-containing protein [Thomasclavelia sp.]